MKTRELLSDMQRLGRASGDVVDRVVMLNAQQEEIRHQLASEQAAFRREVAAKFNTFITRILGGIRNSKALNDNGRQQLLAEALRQVGESMRQLAMQPSTELDNGQLAKITNPLGGACHFEVQDAALLGLL
jgi:hypothetical protein